MKRMTIDFEQAFADLNAFLLAPERGEQCLTIHQFLGMVASASSSPLSVMEAAICFEMLGGDDAAGVDQWFEDGDVRSAWVVCMNTIDELLAMEKFSLDDFYPLETSAQKPSEEFSQWCDGYLRGYMLTETYWKKAYELLATAGAENFEDDHISFLSLLATFQNWDQALRENEKPERLKENYSQVIQAFDDWINKFYQLGVLLEDEFLSEEGDSHAPYVREDVKVGRNDPCPCGSGKKFKKCCLH